MATPQLFTIPISHFCERARWTLEHLSIPYAEKPSLQVFHRKALRRIGAGRTTPALLIGDQTLRDSYEISDWANQQPHDEAHRLVFWKPDSPEAQSLVKWGESLAVWSRIIAYDWLLPERELLLRYNNRGAPAWQGWMLRMGYKKASSLVRQHFKITTEAVQRAKDQLRNAMDQLASRLGHAPYLSIEQGTHQGERFSELDLVLASYLGPVLFPPEYGIRPNALPSLDECPRDMATEIQSFRSHPIGQHVLTVFARHRRQ